MRDGAKRPLSLLMVVMMMCSLAVMPAAAAGEKPSIPAAASGAPKAVSAITTANPDGGKTTVETKADGTVITTVQSKDGSSGVTITDASGQTAATVQLPASAAGEAAGGAVTLPVRGIYASQNISRAPTVTVNTSGVSGVKVEIPVANGSAGVVAVLVKADGTGQLIRNTIPTRDGVAIRVNSGDTIRLLDNRKSFADVQGHWAADAVDFVSSRELFNGTAANTFSPDARMTRGMLMTALARYEGVDTEGGAAWYEKGAAWAAASGLSDGSRLDDSVTREELAAILYRYAVLKGKGGGADVGLDGYTDADCVSGWAADAMNWAVGAGLLKGAAPATLDPQGEATRGQAAAVLMRFAETFGL